MACSVPHSLSLSLSLSASLSDSGWDDWMSFSQSVNLNKTILNRLWKIQLVKILFTFSPICHSLLDSSALNLSFFLSLSSRYHTDSRSLFTILWVTFKGNSFRLWCESLMCAFKYVDHFILWICARSFIYICWMT